MTHADRPSARTVAIVRALVTDRWMPARWLSARAHDRGVSDRVKVRALRALIAAGEVEARGQTWTREYRRAPRVG